MSFTTQQTAPKYSFNIETVGNTHNISYKRGNYSGGVFLLILLSTFLLLVKPLSSLGVFTYIAILAISIGIFTVLNQRRKNGSFQIDDKQIVVNGRSYDLSHINQIHMDKKLTMRDRRSVVINPSVGMSLADSINGVLRKKDTWFIGFRYGEKDIKLAVGMKENTADVLYKKVLALTKGFTQN